MGVASPVNVRQLCLASLVSGLVGAGVAGALGILPPGWSPQVSEIEKVRAQLARVNLIKGKYPSSEVAIMPVGSDLNKVVLLVPTDDESAWANLKASAKIDGVDAVPYIRNTSAIRAAFTNAEKGFAAVPPVTFEIQSDRLDKQGVSAIKAFSKLIKSYPYQIEVKTISDPLIGRDLAAKRLQAVVDALAEQGVGKNSMIAMVSQSSQTVEKRVVIRPTLNTKN